MISRRQFIHMTCSACAGIPALSTILAGCGSIHYVDGTLEQEGLSIPMSEFVEIKNNISQYRQAVVVRNERLEFPICVYRFSETEYSALLMKCTHQGTELQVAGDQLHCSAHGSEFNNRGTVTMGPAEQNLRTFTVIPKDNKVFISLSKS